MRIYAVSDIHGKPERLARIRECLKEYGPDVLVIAGDITNYHGHRRVVSLLNEMGLPVLAVRGNADWPIVDRLLERFSRTRSLHLREAVLDGFSFTGVSGTIPVPFRSRLRWIERPLLQKMEALVTEHTILVAHPPPWGTLDEVLGRFHAGCRGLKGIVLRQQPRILICGHIHEGPGTARLGRTRVVNCNMGGGRSGAIIDMRFDQDPAVKMI
jgi:hypothetical protein